MTEEQWYTNKQLFEMMRDLTDNVGELRAELTETRTLIRDYNGLRERLEKCESRISTHEGMGNGLHSMWGYVVGGLGVLFMIISYAIK